MTALSTVVAAGGAMTAGALQGALIAGLSSWDGKTAATGALLGAGVAGTLAGVGMLGASYVASRPQQVVEGQPTPAPLPPEVLQQLRWTGVGALALGATAAIWGGVRVYRKARGR